MVEGKDEVGRMNVEKENNILRVIGKGFIFFVIMVPAGYVTQLFCRVWDRRCEKATQENRLVEEKNADKAADYIEQEVLPVVGQAALDASAQVVGNMLKERLENVADANSRTEIQK